MATSDAPARTPRTASSTPKHPSPTGGEPHRLADWADPGDAVTGRVGASLVGGEVDIDHVDAPFGALARPGDLILDPDGVRDDLNAALFPSAMADLTVSSAALAQTVM